MADIRKTILEIDGENLNLEKISNFLENKYTEIKLSQKAYKKVSDSHSNVIKILSEKRPVYGINTGFGSFADVMISPDDTATLQKNLIFSHAAGTGELFPNYIVKLIMLFRINALAKGFSGISHETLGQLINFLNKDIIPLVPKYGSVGASGDLAPLSHIALCLLGEGEVFYKEKKMKTAEALKKAGLKKISLKPKEGLALTNGTQMMSAVCAYGCYRFEKLFKTALVSSAMSVEALLGSLTPFSENIHKARPHQGQIETAKYMRKILNKSGIVESHKNCSRIQDAYTLRCIPQVYGACLDTFNYVKKVMEIEVNSATDNPLIFDEKTVESGGNFHGEPIAFVIDFLAIALSEIGSMSERRIDRMLNHSSNKTLPPFLTKNGGLNSGFMIAQYTAAALVSENKILSHPASTDSIPTSANQEDHVSMGSIGAVKLLKTVENVESVVAIELMCACQGVEFHKPLKPSPFLTKVLNSYRKEVKFWEEDRIMYKEIENTKNFINGEKFNNLLEEIWK